MLGVAWRDSEHALRRCFRAHLQFYVAHTNARRLAFPLFPLCFQTPQSPLPPPPVPPASLSLSLSISSYLDNPPSTTPSLTLPPPLRSSHSPHLLPPALTLTLTLSLSLNLTSSSFSQTPTFLPSPPQFLTILIQWTPSTLKSSPPSSATSATSIACSRSPAPMGSKPSISSTKCKR